MDIFRSASRVLLFYDHSLPLMYQAVNQAERPWFKNRAPKNRTFSQGHAWESTNGRRGKAGEANEKKGC